MTGAPIIDLGAPEGGRYWRVTTGEPSDHPDARAAAIHARATGSVGCTYNDVHVERLSEAELEDLDAEAADAEDLELWRAGEHLPALRLRAAQHAAEREGATADARKLAALVDNREAREGAR